MVTVAVVVVNVSDMMGFAVFVSVVRNVGNFIVALVFSLRPLSKSQFPQSSERRRNLKGSLTLATVNARVRARASNTARACFSIKSLGERARALENICQFARAVWTRKIHNWYNWCIHARF